MPGFFCPSLRMACKIKNIKPCGYSAPGVLRIALLDLEDLQGVEFSDLATIATVQRLGEFSELIASSGAKYSSAEIKGGHSHTLETFVPSLSGEVSAELWKASKNKYLIIFIDGQGLAHAFGIDSPATLTFQASTEEGGFAVSINSNSKYPLLEVADLTFEARADYVPDFDGGAFCIFE